MALINKTDKPSMKYVPKGARAGPKEELKLSIFFDDVANTTADLIAADIDLSHNIKTEDDSITIIKNITKCVKLAMMIKPLVMTQLGQRYLPNRNCWRLLLQTSGNILHLIVSRKDLGTRNCLLLKHQHCWSVLVTPSPTRLQQKMQLKRHCGT